MKETPRVGEVWAVWYSGIESVGFVWYFLMLDFDDEHWHALRLDGGSMFGPAGTVARLRFDQPTKRIT